jgi:hypothetical protein
MDKVINLRQQRKAKIRAEKEKKAGENRNTHGRKKAEKQLDKKEAARILRHIEGHKRETEEKEK